MTEGALAPHPSSFRDPSGYLFTSDGILYRQVNNCYKDQYDLLLESGLYDELVGEELLVAHEEATVKGIRPDIAYRIIRPRIVPFISYPYEWSFSQLKDAALLTLDVQERALSRGMCLKDASAYNIQYVRGKPLFIDTLSFERYEEGKPWIAYRQFCQHFLAPLALMSYRDVRLSQLLRIHIDGVPLDLAAKLLPRRTLLRFGLLAHLHLHARSEKKYETRKIDVKEIHGVSKASLISFVRSLKHATAKLKWEPAGTEWAEYDKEMNYTDASIEHKKRLVSEYLDRLCPRELWDLGANTGIFSRIAASKGISTVALDMDPACVELNYIECRNGSEGKVLPLLVDFENPSPGMGWHNQERLSLVERGPVEAALALALVHHLAISNNVPLALLAEYFADVCDNLIIEFVPKTDSQVQRLLLSREDIFDDYARESFEAAFAQRFVIEDSVDIAESQRILYLMKRKVG